MATGCRCRRSAGGTLLEPLLAVLVDVQGHALHGAADGRGVFLGGQRAQALCGRQLDVDAQPVGVAAGAGQQFGRCVRDGLEVDIAAKVMVFAQHPSDFHHLLHGVVGALDDAAGKEQSFDAVAPVEIQRQRHHLVHREAGASDIAADAIDAIQAVVEAEVGEEDLEQRDAAAIGCVAVADAHAFGRADAAAAHRIAPLAPAGSARGVVFCCVGQDGEFLMFVHCWNVQSCWFFVQL